MASLLEQHDWRLRYDRLLEMFRSVRHICRLHRADHHLTDSLEEFPLRPSLRLKVVFGKGGVSEVLRFVVVDLPQVGVCDVAALELALVVQLKAVSVLVHHEFIGRPETSATAVDHAHVRPVAVVNLPVFAVMLEVFVDVVEGDVLVGVLLLLLVLGLFDDMMQHVWVMRRFVVQHQRGVDGDLAWFDVIVFIQLLLCVFGLYAVLSWRLVVGDVSPQVGNQVLSAPEVLQAHWAGSFPVPELRIKRPVGFQRQQQLAAERVGDDLPLLVVLLVWPHVELLQAIEGFLAGAKEELCQLAGTQNFQVVGKEGGHHLAYGCPRFGVILLRQLKGFDTKPHGGKYSYFLCLKKEKNQQAQLGDVNLPEHPLVGNQAAFGAGFGQHARLGHLAHLLQVLHPHLHEALALQADLPPAGRGRSLTVLWAGGLAGEQSVQDRVAPCSTFSRYLQKCLQSEPLQNEPHSVGVCGQVGSGRGEAVNGQTVDLQQRQTMFYGVPAPSVVHQRLQTERQHRKRFSSICLVPQRVLRGRCRGDFLLSENVFESSERSQQGFHRDDSVLGRIEGPVAPIVLRFDIILRHLRSPPRRTFGAPSSPARSNMGKSKQTGNHKGDKKKNIAKKWKTKRRTKDLDQIHSDMKPETAAKLLRQDVDYDVTGCAQHYCLHCARYFVDMRSLKEHFKTKVHKKRLKQLREEPYSQAEAERAAGMGSYIAPKTIEPCLQQV
ncbi:hypothetical protein CCH79_00015133 [Gambusia affinis]|uniref:Zinc finger protein 593 n=1 Tax=Gambusia affinis TaxID=33528 RepID=A0A315VJQ4_GAMAF|nr:hypothetical protein CCH79_00015133 [Gambusia affinis]